MGEIGIPDRFADSLDQPRARQDLRHQRDRRGVMAREQRQALAGMLGRNAGEQMQIIVDDRLGDRLTGDIDHTGPRVSQQEQKAQHTLFVMMRAGDLGEDLLIEGQARQDQHAARCQGVGEHRFEDLRELGLQSTEGFDFAGGRRGVDLC